MSEDKKDLVEGEIGSEGKYDVDFSEGKILVDIGYKGEQAEAGIYLKLDLIDMLKIAASKSENTIDDAAVAMIAGMLS